MNKYVWIYMSIICLSCVACSNKINETLKSAQNGDHKAQCEMGMAYETGSDGIQQNFHTAMEWYRKAVEGGDMGAPQYLGAMYATGEGVDKDYKEAIRLYEIAAKRYNIESQFILSNLYYEGKVVQKDTVKAYAWVSLAINDEGEMGESAKKRIEVISSTMTPNQLLLSQIESARLINDLKKK